MKTIGVAKVFKSLARAMDHGRDVALGSEGCGGATVMIMRALRDNSRQYQATFGTRSHAVERACLSAEPAGRSAA
jgi:hypothetical protein